MMSAPRHSIDELDLGDPRYYLVDANTLIDFCKGNYLDWIDTLSEKPIFIITDNILAETLLPVRKIKRILSPLGVDVEIVTLLNSEDIKAQHAFLIKNRAYQRPNDALSPVDSSLLAISLVHPTLKMVTNDGLLQFAFMDRHSRDIHLDDSIAEQECPDGLIFDHRAKDFCVAHIHLKYASAVFGLKWYDDVVKHCKLGLKYLKSIPENNSPDIDRKEHSSGPDGDKGDNNSLFRVKERLIEQIGWAYVNLGHADEVLDAAQSLIRHNENSTAADKFFSISGRMNRNPQPRISSPSTMGQGLYSRKRAFATAVAHGTARVGIYVGVNEAVSASMNPANNNMSNWKSIFNSMYPSETVDLDGNAVDPMFAPFQTAPGGEFAGDGLTGDTDAVGGGIDF